MGFRPFKTSVILFIWYCLDFQMSSGWRSLAFTFDDGGANIGKKPLTEGAKKALFPIRRNLLLLLAGNIARHALATTGPWFQVSGLIISAVGGAFQPSWPWSYCTHADSLILGKGRPCQPHAPILILSGNKWLPLPLRMGAYPFG